MSKLPSISEAEYEVMKIIWAYAPISTNEVVDKLHDISEWTPKTIQSLLGRLVKKGVLDYRKNSRVFVYTPLLEEETYLEQESDLFLKRFYNGELNTMVAYFLGHHKLDKNDLQLLKQMIEKKLKES